MRQDADPLPQQPGLPSVGGPTSLNSGFRVFLRTLVLYFDFFPALGCRKLGGIRLVSVWPQRGEPRRGSEEPPLPTRPPASHSQADEGVRVAVGVHGGEVGAAQHAHQQAAPLRAVAQRQQDAPALLPGHLRLHLLPRGRRSARVAQRPQGRRSAPRGPPSGRGRLAQPMWPTTQLPTSTGPDRRTQTGRKEIRGRCSIVWFSFPILSLT